MTKKLNLILILLVAASLPLAAEEPGEETAGNNLSVPVIWAEGVEKALRGEFGVVTLDGAWWYWWWVDETAGTYDTCAADPDCPLFPDETCLCDDGVSMQMGGSIPGPEGSEDPVWDFIVYPQQDPGNEWQAESASWGAPVQVHWVDWGDNLESVDWNLRSQVRTEVVLIQELLVPMLQYEMLHLEGLGIEELWGTTGNSSPGSLATIYSYCPRFRIQKLNVPREDPALVDLVWDQVLGWTDPNATGEPMISQPIFDMAVHEGGDGPGYYTAEINVKGRIIYGYTWNVRKLNQGDGDYRLTFSFDDPCKTVPLNTYFVDGITQIVPVAEEEEETILVPEGGEETGGVGVLDFENNLTYMDIRILKKEENGNGGGQGGNPN